MINVIFLGFGNVNINLCKALYKNKQVSVIQIYNRSKIDVIDFIDSKKFTQNIAEISEADVYIIGIADDAIQDFSEALSLENKLIVHTSGGVSLKTLSNKNRRGVFYPLQTFSKSCEVQFKNVPICIEAENKNDLELLQKLGSILSDNVIEISSEKREKLHLAAVFVNNFTNYIYGIGSDILKEENLPFSLLSPLIAETASKIENLSPKDSQTGPAKRNDFKTIEKHLHLLHSPEYKEIYTLLTNGIINTQKELE